MNMTFEKKKKVVLCCVLAEDSADLLSQEVKI